MRSKLGLDIELLEVKGGKYSSVFGLVGGSQNGSLLAENGTGYAKNSSEEQFYEFGNTCTQILVLILA